MESSPFEFASMKIKQRVLAYVRISHRDASASLEGQTSLIEEFCRVNEWEKPLIFAEKAGVSGASEDKPVQRELLNTVRKGDFVCIVDFTRIARDQLLFQIFMRELYQKGGQLKVTAMPSWKWPDDKLVAEVMISSGAYTRQQAAQKQRDRAQLDIRKAKERGDKVLPRGTIPYGAGSTREYNFDPDPKRLQTIRDCVFAILLIHNWRAQNYTMQSIVNALNGNDQDGERNYAYLPFPSPKMMSGRKSKSVTKEWIVNDIARMMNLKLEKQFCLKGKTQNEGFDYCEADKEQKDFFVVNHNQTFNGMRIINNLDLKIEK